MKNTLLGPENFKLIKTQEFHEGKLLIAIKSETSVHLFILWNGKESWICKHFCDLLLLLLALTLVAFVGSVETVTKKKNK